MAFIFICITSYCMYLLLCSQLHGSITWRQYLYIIYEYDPFQTGWFQLEFAVVAFSNWMFMFPAFHMFGQHDTFLVFYSIFARLPYASCCFSEPVWVITSPCNIRTLGWWKRHGSSEAWFHMAWGQCPIEEQPWNREMGGGVSLGFDSTTFWVLTSRNSAGTKLG